MLFRQTADDHTVTAVIEGGDGGGGVGNIFLYTGGEQIVPRDVTHVLVDNAVKIVRRNINSDRQTCTMRLK